MYVFRLDDASEYMDVEKWNKIDSIFDKYAIKPIVGIIPHNEDTSMIHKYACDDTFWVKALNWKKKGWRIAQHGYNHAYATKSGGINPVNKKSEFAGLPLEQQKEKIRRGYEILCAKNLKPDIFFAPSHTFDENTLEALKSETDIRIISDTIANDVYKDKGFYYIPQQSGKLRKLPFRITTICFHPNNFTQESFVSLENFLKENDICDPFDIELKSRKICIYEKIMRRLYFSLRHIRQQIVLKRVEL